MKLTTPPPLGGNNIKLLGKKGREKGKGREGSIFFSRGKERLDFLPLGRKGRVRVGKALFSYLNLLRI